MICRYCKNVRSITCDEASTNRLKNLPTFCTSMQRNIQSKISDNFDDAFGYLFSKNKMLQVIDVPYYVRKGNFLLKVPYEEITTINIYWIESTHENNIIGAMKKCINLSSLKYADDQS